MKTHWAVAAALVTFTAITVAFGVVPALDFGAPGITGGDIALALSIAVAQSSLVMLIFMHLKNERGLIYKMLTFTVVFAAALMALSLLALGNHVRERTDVLDRVVSGEKAGGPAATSQK